jgi:hypothetical protein
MSYDEGRNEKFNLNFKFYILKNGNWSLWYNSSMTDTQQKTLFRWTDGHIVAAFLIGFISALIVLVFVQAKNVSKQEMEITRFSAPRFNSLNDSLYFETITMQNGSVIDIKTDSVIYFDVKL